MKKTSVRSIIAAPDADFHGAISTLQTVAGTGSPISQDDKAGAKISDKELSLLPWVMEQLSCVENFLPRDFDPIAVKDNLASLNNEKAQLDTMLPVVNHLTNSTTVRRVELKDIFSIIYEAAYKTKNKNAAMGYVYDKMQILYARANQTTEQKVEKVDTKTAQKVTPAAE